MADKDSKSKSEQFDLWKKRIQLARNLHHEKVVAWARKVIKEYSGESRFNEETGEQYELIAQVIMGVEETIQPHLFFQNPTFFGKARQTDSPWEKREDPVAQIVNYEYKDIKDSGYGIELENELAILDARLLPFGVTKTSYDVEGEVLLEKREQNLAQKAKSMLTGESNVIETPIITKDKGQITERKNPLFILLDPTSEHITKQKYVIERMFFSKSDLQKPRYTEGLRNVNLDDLEPTATLVPESNKAEDQDAVKKHRDDPDFKAFEGFEIEDLEHRVIHTVLQGVKDFIEYNSPHPLPEGSQYEFLWFIEVPNEVYPSAPLKYYRLRANEFSYIYSQVSTQIDKFLPKLGININALDKPEQTKFKKGNLGTFVAFNKQPKGEWEQIQLSVQADLFKYLAMIKELLNLESGVTDYEIAVPEKRSPTEAALITAGTRGRRTKPQKRVKGFLRHQARNIWHIKAKNAPFEHFVKVLGIHVATEWWNDPETGKLSWTDENLAGDYWFDYDIESTVPQDEATRNQLDIEAFNTIKDPIVQQMLLLEDPPKRLRLSPILEKIIKNRWKVRNVENIIEDLSVLKPEQEHDLWMQGQFPPIQEQELKDQQFLLEHYQKHQAWINSPGFDSLLPQIREGAIAHVEQYMPLVEPLLNKGQGSQPKPLGQPSQPKLGKPSLTESVL